MRQDGYFLLPPVARNVAASLVGWRKQRRRFGGEYERWHAYFTRNARRSAAALDDELLATAEAWLHEVCAQASHYAPLRDRLKATKLRDWADLARLPVLPKDAVKAAPEAFLVADAGRRGLEWHRTSGSTGSPLRVPWYPADEQFQWAFVWARARPGVDRGDRSASFTGQTICDPKTNVPPFWVDNWPARQRLFSIHHLSDDNLRHYARALDRFRPAYMTGYSSAAAFLASGLVAEGRSLEAPPRAFFASSEQLLPVNRKVIEEGLNCRVWDHYGQVELACAITEYECGRLHVDEDYARVEFEPIDVEADGTITAELIATNIHNRRWPLLRYRTGDLAVHHPDDRCPCGRPGRVVKEIAGRTNRFIRLKDGRKLFNLTTTLRLIGGIRTAQARALADGEIELLFVRDEAAANDVERDIVRVFRDRFGSNLEVRPRPVAEGIRTGRGKFMTIVD